jgi:hypothetical protein
MPGGARRSLAETLASALAFALALTVAGAQAKDEPTLGPEFTKPMSFSLVKDASGNDIIFAVGEIVDDPRQGHSDRDFAAFLGLHKLEPGATVVLHSPGGAVYVGMRLGRLFRQLSLQTAVGQQPTGKANQNNYKVADSGECDSACTLAFLGGVRRAVPEGSVYGIHAIASKWSSSGPSDKPSYEYGVFLGQEMAGDVSQYLEEMGIDPEYLYYFSRYDSALGRLLAVPRDLLDKWNVTTASLGTKWEVVPKNETFYLIGSNPDAPYAPHQHEELYFLCTVNHAARMGAAYLPSPKQVPAALLAPIIRGYALVAPKAHPAVVIGAADEGATKPLELADQDVVEKAHVNFGDPRLRVEINITPEVAALLDGASDLAFRFLQFGPLYLSVEVDFDAERQTYRSFLRSCK